LALLLLYLSGSLTIVEIVAAGIMLAIILAVGGLMVAGLRSEAALLRLYRAAARPLNAAARLLRRPPVIDVATAPESVRDIYDAVSQVKRKPLHYAQPFAHALAVEALSIGMLWTVALAVRGDAGFEVAVAGYAISLLFSMIAITPAGIGFVEASLSVLLVSFGVDRHAAIATALGYRLFEFWIPLLLGAVSLHLLRERGEAPR